MAAPDAERKAGGPDAVPLVPRPVSELPPPLERAVARPAGPLLRVGALRKLRARRERRVALAAQTPVSGAAALKARPAPCRLGQAEESLPARRASERRAARTGAGSLAGQGLPCSLARRATEPVRTAVAEQPDVRRSGRQRELPAPPDEAA